MKKERKPLKEANEELFLKVVHSLRRVFDPPWTRESMSAAALLACPCFSP
ncbi:MAG: hypothetical protein KAH99_05705 [Verrucomicrobia bacterium]|nr:hypothetical protein [Verrucomicrobiota bacterium]